MKQKKYFIAVTLFALFGCQSTPNIQQDSDYSGKSQFPNQTDPAQLNNLIYPENSLVKPLDLKDLPDTIRTEHTDRVNRLTRLSHKFNAPLPTQEDLQVATGKVPGANFPVPVIRLRYQEQTFFDFNKADIRPESAKILDVLAEQMNRDLPDTSLVILGHTDSVGTDEYNTQLSVQRAAAVMKELAKRGVSLEQISTVGIGESQPVTTNASESGRALNRRVEFLLSRFAEANYVAIEQFPRNTEWLNNQEKATDTSKVKIKHKPVVLHDTGAKELVVLKPTKDMLVKSRSEPVAQLKKSDRVVTIKPAEIFHIRPAS